MRNAHPAVAILKVHLMVGKGFTSVLQRGSAVCPTNMSDKAACVCACDVYNPSHHQPTTPSTDKYCISFSRSLQVDSLFARHTMSHLAET